MNSDKIKRLDILRSERNDIEYFISGNGNFGIKVYRFFITKFFGCGTHELLITNKLTRLKIEKILIDRLQEINDEIEEM